MFSNWFFCWGGRHSFVLCFCTLFVLIKRATGAYRSCHSLQNNGSDSLWLLFTKRAKERRAKEWFALFKSGVEKKTSHSFFSPCFSPLYAQNKRANSSGRSLQKDWKKQFALLKEWIALSLPRNVWFTRKPKEQIPNPAFIVT